MQPLNEDYGAALSRWFGLHALRDSLTVGALVRDGPFPMIEGAAEEWVGRAAAYGVDRSVIEPLLQVWTTDNDKEALGAMYDLLQASGEASLAVLAAVPRSLGKSLDQLRVAIADQLDGRHAV